MLGGGIDFMTGVRIEDEHQMSPARRRERARRSGWCSRRSCTAPPSGAPSAASSGAPRRAAHAVRRPRGVGARSSEYRIATIAITGDAMARPLIDALQEHELRHVVARRHRLHRGGVLARGEGPAVRAAAQPVHQRGGGLVGERLQRHAPGREGQHRTTDAASSTSPAGPTRSSSTSDDQPVQPGEIGRMARGGNVPLEYYKDPEKSAATFIDGRRQALLRARRLGPPRARRHHDAARPRLAVHQLRRREDLPRGGRVGAQGATRRCSTPSSSASPTSGGASGSPPSSRPGPGEVPTLDELVEHCRTKIAGYKVPRQLHLVDEMPRHPSGKPDYRARPRRRRGGPSMKNRLTEMFGIEYPIFAFCHCRDVVAAVTNAGGMGVLGALAFSPEQLELELKWIDEHVDGKPYGVDVVMPVKTVDRDAGLADTERHRRQAPASTSARSTGTTSTRSSPTTASTVAAGRRRAASRAAGMGAGRARAGPRPPGAPQIEIALSARHRPAGLAPWARRPRRPSTRPTSRA